MFCQMRNWSTESVVNYVVFVKDVFYQAAEKKITEAYFYSILEDQLPKVSRIS